MLHDFIYVLGLFKKTLILVFSHITEKLSGTIYRHPDFFAVYVQFTFCAILFMACIIYKRRKQRLEPKQTSSVTISPVIPPVVKDRTIAVTAAVFAVLIIALLLIMSSP